MSHTYWMILVLGIGGLVKLPETSYQPYMRPDFEQHEC
jgi:hypothetical protein